MGATDSKSPQGVVSEPEPELPGGQFAFYSDPGPWWEKLRRVGNGWGRVGWAAIDFEKGRLPEVHPAAAGVVLATLAVNDGGVEEARSKASQAAVGADGAAEAGKGGGQIVGCAPAHSDSPAGRAPES